MQLGAPVDSEPVPVSQLRARCGSYGRSQRWKVVLGAKGRARTRAAGKSLWVKSVWGARTGAGSRNAMQEPITGLRSHSASRLLEDNSQLPPLGGSRKRAFDVTMASVALVALMPLIILTAILVRLLTKEPTILSERLIGRGGKIFVGYRFRTPVPSADSISRWEERVAQALSSSSLDKLPQFFNVIRGDMSLIGPRPRAAVEFRNYLAQAPECLPARPGLISISQSSHPIFKDQRTETALDRCYVSNWSLGLDLALLKMSAISGNRADKRPR